MIGVLASILGVVVGLAGGTYLAEFGRGRLAWVIRFLADVLSGVPSITVGLLRLRARGCANEQLLAIAGALALPS